MKILGALFVLCIAAAVALAIGAGVVALEAFLFTQAMPDVATFRQAAAGFTLAHIAGATLLAPVFRRVRA